MQIFSYSSVQHNDEQEAQRNFIDVYISTASMIFYVLDKLEHHYLPKKCILLGQNILQACQQLFPINIISSPGSIASDSRISFRVGIESKFPDITKGRWI